MVEALKQNKSLRHFEVHFYLEEDWTQEEAIMRFLDMIGGSTTLQSVKCPSLGWDWDCEGKGKESYWLALNGTL